MNKYLGAFFAFSVQRSGLFSSYIDLKSQANLNSNRWTVSDFAYLLSIEKKTVTELAKRKLCGGSFMKF